jgi:hypothetical protein
VRTIATIVSIACAVATVTTACETTPFRNPSPDPTSPGSAPPAARQWAMPDLVGRGLQDAQDQIQKLTGDRVFYTGSHDLSGQGRHQVVDANWKVCTQNIAPGAAVTPTAKIDFGVVKTDESCP